MPAKTIYVRDVDLPLFEWLAELGRQEGRSMSWMLAEAIKILQNDPSLLWVPHG